MGFLGKKKDASVLRKELEAEERELAGLRLKAAFAEERRELKAKIKGVKQEKSKEKYGDVVKGAKEVGKSIGKAGKTLGGILGTMAENQAYNQKKSKKKDDSFGFW